MSISKKKYTNIAGWISMGVNLLLFGLKFWIGIITGSIALMADAWHTISDSISSIILLVGNFYANKPADEDHPFGHGRAELITAMIIGFLLAIISLNFVVESIKTLMHRESVNFGMLAIIVTSISIVLKEILARYAFWVANKVNSNAVKADAWHHRSDAISSLIILIGIVLGNYFWWIDGVLGILVALFIFHASYSILSEAINPLLGEIPDPELIKSIQNICHDQIASDSNAHHFHIHRYGDHTELTFHIKLPGELTLDQAHHFASETEKKIFEKYKIEATIHMEPSPAK
jgi:cation diffusion facilitator family transporter